MQAWQTWVGFLMVAFVVGVIFAPNSHADRVFKAVGGAQAEVIKALHGA